MRTLAFSSDTEKLNWLIVEGFYSSPKLVSQKLERIKLPSNIEEGEGLCSLIRTLGLLIDTQTPKQVAVLQPGKSKFQNTSFVRIKIEAALQIAATQKNVPLHLVSPVSVSAYKKKLDKAGLSLEAVLNDGRRFSPIVMSDVICAGAIKLPHE